MLTTETWTVARSLHWMKERFQSRGVDSARLDAELLLASVLGCDRLGVVTRADQPLNETERATLRDLVGRRQKREPVAYILGQKGFRDFDLSVGSGVLIPRPETEFVVDIALELELDQKIPPGNVVDLGTGSGAIAIALARAWPDRAVTGIEKSTCAAEYARRNAAALAPSVKITVGDWQDNLPDTITLAVANPPYVPETDRVQLAPELEHEPAEALFSGPQGLDDIRQLSSLLSDTIEPDGWWICEVGQNQRIAIENILENDGWGDLFWTADYSGIDRVFAVCNNNVARILS